jgi:hypothetical protein
MVRANQSPSYWNVARLSEQPICNGIIQSVKPVAAGHEKNRDECMNNSISRIVCGFTATWPKQRLEATRMPKTMAPPNQKTL